MENINRKTIKEEIAENQRKHNEIKKSNLESSR